MGKNIKKLYEKMKLYSTCSKYKFVLVPQFFQNNLELAIKLKIYRCATSLAYNYLLSEIQSLKHINFLNI